jgi:ubiquinone/menaquinone biosynthesis C-methylase UbiE
VVERLRPRAETAPRRFAAAVASAVNEIARSTPAPLDFPFFGLDHPWGVGTRLLDRLSELGIFRFYERVLDLSTGLGGPARWLARRRGCRVASVDPARDRAQASRDLVRRAHLDRLVTVGVALFERLPFADGSFTHAWCVHSLEARVERARVFAELFRVLRPGGHVALQEWLARVGAGGLPDYPTAEAYLEVLRAVGFRGGHMEAAGSLREDESAIAEIVCQRAAQHLGPPSAEEHAALEGAAARLREVERAIAEGRLELVQVFAQKPT